MGALKQTGKVLLLGLLISFGAPLVAEAAQSSSNNYQVNEVFFGSGGELDACSNSYCAKQSAGELVTGNTRSTNFQAQGGFNTNREPYLEFIVSNTTADLGTLNATSTRTANSTFTVRSYLSHGYVVTNASDPPRNDSYTMQPMGVPGPSQPGTEQFGINLVANTMPVSFGDNPLQLPDNTFAYGQVATDYASPNNYKYAKGENVASSTASTSTTQYTVSYLFNVSNVTPGGTYILRHVLVATGTY